MFLLHPNGVFDFDLDFLVELLELIDGQLEKIHADAKKSPDPDGDGIFDRGESAIGLGFVVCQQYINATYPQLRVSDKLMALRAGPKHASGAYTAELINAAANFWKHHDEWPPGGSKNEDRTRTVIESIGLSSRKSYVLSNVLYRIVQPQPSCFRSVVPLLIGWRDQLIEQWKQQSSNGE